MFRSLFVASCVAVSMVASPVLAWDEVGHMLTMLVAYKQLSPRIAPSPAVKNLVAILKHRPRYQEDFAHAMPRGLTNDGEARRLLCRASVWPDLVRNDPENAPSYPPQPAKQGSYHRRVWHYIDTPLLIFAAGTSDENVNALEAMARAGQDLATDIPSDEARVRNALQAIGFNRRQFVDGTPERKAVALCWLLHVIGDIHQPLHATAAFSLRALDPAEHPHGDAGGNAIRLNEQNLHALWDAAPDASPDHPRSPSEPFEQRYQRAYARALQQIDGLLADADLSARGKQAAQVRDPLQWVRESFKLAEEKVYVAEIRRQILAADKEQKPRDLKPSGTKPSDRNPFDQGLHVQLPSGYRDRAHEIARLRVVQGGYRTAELLAVAAAEEAATPIRRAEATKPISPAEATKPIGPAEAAKKVGEVVTLKMEVKSATLRGDVGYLNSEIRYNDPKNFRVFLGRSAVQKFREAKINDPAEHFKGKVIEVHGKIELYNDRPELKVASPEQINIVQESSKPIGPADAATKVGEVVTLIMEVKSATLKGEIGYLNSEKEFTDPENFSVFLDKPAVKKFKEAKIEDPAEHFKGKMIEVHGRIELYRDRPEIKVVAPQQIKIVEVK